MVTTFQSLPREVVDLLIDDLHENGDEVSQKALRSCHLVCRVFCQRSRQHLFRHINLSSDRSERITARLRSLFPILKSNSGGGIASYIKAFEIVIDSTRDTANEDYTFLLRDSEDVLGRVVNALHGICKFSLAMSSSPPIQMGYVEWSDLTPTLQDSIFKIAKSLSLSVFHLGNIHGIPSDLLSDTKLEHLHLSHTRFSERDGVLAIQPSASTSRLSSPPLGCLTMNPSDCLVGIAGGYLSHLTRLVTFTTTIFTLEHLDITWAAVQASASSIISIQLDFYEMFPPPPRAFDFGQITKLQNLSLTHTVTMPDEGMDLTTAERFDEDVHHIHALLDTLTPALSLQKLQIMITSWQVFPDDSFFAVLPTASKWHSIDALLTSPKYPSLTHVEIFLTLPVLVEHAQRFNQKDFKVKVIEYFKTVLPSLSSSKTLAFQIDVRVILFGWRDEEIATIANEEPVEDDDETLDT